MISSSLAIPFTSSSALCSKPCWSEGDWSPLVLFFLTSIPFLWSKVGEIIHTSQPITLLCHAHPHVRSFLWHSHKMHCSFWWSFHTSTDTHPFTSLGSLSFEQDMPMCQGKVPIHRVPVIPLRSFVLSEITSLVIPILYILYRQGKYETF